MKKKYTIKDFFAGKCSILCNTKEEYDKVIELCEEKGVLWNAGEKAKECDGWSISGTVLSINYHGNHRLTWASRKEWYLKARQDVRDKVVSFEELQSKSRPVYELHFTSNDGKTTHAVFKVNGKVIKRSLAKCSPLDRFNFFIGVQTAFDRLKESKKA